MRDLFFILVYIIGVWCMMYGGFKERAPSWIWFLVGAVLIIIGAANLTK